MAKKKNIEEIIVPGNLLKREIETTPKIAIPHESIIHSLYDGDGHRVEEFIGEIKDAYEHVCTIPCNDNIRLKFEVENGYYDERYYYLKLKWNEIKETDEQHIARCKLNVQKRIYVERETKKTKKQKEYDLYLKLKEKYGENQ